MHPLTRTLLGLVVAAAAAGAAFGAELVVHVAPNGNDGAKGTSEADAVATLERALKIAEGAPAGTDQVRIAIKPGVYRAQTADTRGNRDGVPILVTTAGGGRPVFDGDGKGGTWLTLKPRGGQPSNLKLVGLEVRNYETAIDLEGNRNTPGLWVGGVELRENRFANIGDVARAGAQPSTAAVRLVNADNNVIVRNQFIGVRNNEKCALIHAIYVAHGSTNNLIEGNRFEDSCGDSVRFRDRSDNNVVRGNTFVDAWFKSPVSDWFCNQERREDCTKASGECPSSNLLIEGNKVTARSLPAATVFVGYGGKPPASCGISSDAQRAIVR